MSIKLDLKFLKMTSYWNGKHGAEMTVDGKHDSGHWHTDCDWLNGVIVVDEFQDVEQAVKDHLAKHYLPNEYLLIMDDGRLCFNCIEDNSSNIIDTTEEQDEIEAEGKQLYICDYDIYINIIAEPTAEQLSIMFPSAEKAF